MSQTQIQLKPDIESPTLNYVCRQGFRSLCRKPKLLSWKNLNQSVDLRLSQPADSWIASGCLTVLHHDNRLTVLNELGLGDITVGHPSTLLSGGEAQRVKLATELSKLKRGKRNLYILDEPTTGLHFADIDRLLESLNRLVDKGHTVLIIEHNLDVIKSADYVIDPGPEGGHKGGKVMTKGTPEKVAKSKTSHTARFLREALN